MARTDSLFRVLLKKDIYEFLEGSGPTLVSYKGKEYGLPYYTGAELERLCTEFGVTEPVVGSRWCYVEALLEYAIEHQRCDELLQLLFSEGQFSNLQDIETVEEVDSVYRQIIAAALGYINKSIRLSKYELICINGHYIMTESGKAPVIETPKLNVRSIPYVQGLRGRCEEDFTAQNYDSVITKSRTMMEEILVQILEEAGVSEIAKGDLIRQYNQVKNVLKMQQFSEYDKRVNSLLSGLERIVQAVAEMRNANSDAHGVGSRRIAVRECEARLVMNSAITFCEYIISVHDK